MIPSMNTKPPLIFERPVVCQGSRSTCVAIFLAERRSRMTDDEILKSLTVLRSIADKGTRIGVFLSARRCRSIVAFLDVIRLELSRREPKEEDDS